MISIVTAYYNRKQLFKRTLESIAKSAVKDFELIAVDDASKEEERLEDLVEQFPFMRIIRVEPKDKWYYNSAMPFNMGIAQAKGDIIVLQNPECLHHLDVLSQFIKEVDQTNYVTATCYSMNKRETEEWKWEMRNNTICWYNNVFHRPVYFHFCAAMTTENMKKLGGFDERYAMGIAYDDNDLVDRITRLGLKKIISEDIFVYHQWHPKVYDLANPIHKALYERNARLHKQTRHEKTIQVVNRYA
jgi:GT2 family glycosyltransferase